LSKILELELYNSKDMNEELYWLFFRITMCFIVIKEFSIYMLYSEEKAILVELTIKIVLIKTNESYTSK